MRPSKLAILRVKIIGFVSKIRNHYYRILGLRIGSNCLIGKIYCEWPSSVSIGLGCTIQDNVAFWIKNPFNYENFIEIGNKVFIGRNCEFNCSCKIIIGDNSLLASYCVFVDINHSIDKFELIQNQPIIKNEIIIGKDVWIGSKCIILKGVTIGNGSVVGAGSVVNKSIPEYEIWAGVPARKIGDRK